MLWWWLRKAKSKSSDDRAEAARELGASGDPKAIEPLVVLLHDSFPHVRANAVEALANLGWGPGNAGERALLEIAKGHWGEVLAIGASAVDPLAEALQSQDYDLRTKAADALGTIGDQRAVKPLIAALNDSHNSVREAAAQALGKIGDPSAIEPLAALLKDNKEGLRQAAARALGKIRDERVIGFLAFALKDKNSLVREVAVEELGTRRHAAIFEPLLSALQDTEGSVRDAAVRALGDLGDARAVEPLVAMLRERDSVHSAWALGKLGDPRAVEPLLEKLKHESTLMRRAAALALSQLGDARAAGTLTVMLCDPDKKVRQEAAVALGELGDPCAVGPLLEAYSQEKELGVRWRCLRSLGKLRDPRALDCLLARLSEEKKGWTDERIAAAEALGEIGDPRAVDPFIAVLQDKGKWVSRLGMLGLGLSKFVDMKLSFALLASKEDGVLPEEISTVVMRLPAGDPLGIAMFVALQEGMLREAVARGLGRIGDPKAVQPLAAVVQDASGVPSWEKAVEVAKQIAAKGVEAYLEKVRQETRIQNVEALKAPSRIPKEHVLAPLVEFAENQDFAVRLEAVRALGSIPGPDATDALRAALENKDSRISDAAAAALEARAP